MPWKARASPTPTEAVVYLLEMTVALALLFTTVLILLTPHRTGAGGAVLQSLQRNGTEDDIDIKNISDSVTTMLNYGNNDSLSDMFNLERDKRSTTTDWKKLRFSKSLVIRHVFRL